MTTCRHNWQLHPSSQRIDYKCTKCGALGFFENHTSRIKERKCERKGCNAVAVDKVNGVRLCARHKNEV